MPLRLSMEYSAWLKQAMDAIDHYDAVPAWRCLKAWAELERAGQLPLKEKQTELMQLRQSLVYTAFPVLPQEDAKKLLETSVLGFLRHEPDLDDRLEVRYAYLGYHEKDVDMAALRNSLLLNREMIGGVLIKDWIAKFNKLFPLTVRTEESPSDFMTRDSSIVRLAKDEQQILRKLVTVYDNWLSEPGVIEIGAADAARSNQPVKTVRMPLLKAMNEYRHLSEQLLTNDKIKLKSSMELVRPSLGNWLKSYREELGIGVHEPVKRGNFLFQSQNGKRLTNDDRARLNLILKSVEEEFPLEIDTVHQTIQFPKTSDTSMELSQVKASGASKSRIFIQPRGMVTAGVTPAPAPFVSRPISPKTSTLSSLKPLFGKVAAPEKNVSGETLHFSTGHVLPAEREVPAAPVTTDGNEALRQMQPPTQGIRREPQPSITRSPYSIRPLRPRNGGNGGAD